MDMFEDREEWVGENAWIMKQRVWDLEVDQSKPGAMLWKTTLRPATKQDKWCAL